MSVEGGMEDEVRTVVRPARETLPGRRHRDRTDHDPQGQSIRIHKFEFNPPGNDLAVTNSKLNRGYVVLKNTGPPSEAAHRLDAGRQDPRTSTAPTASPSSGCDQARYVCIHTWRTGFGPNQGCKGTSISCWKGNHDENACKEYGQQHRGDDDDPPQYDVSNGESSASLAPPEPSTCFLLL